jgi:hypothetical protein
LRTTTRTSSGGRTGTVVEVGVVDVDEVEEVDPSDVVVDLPVLVEVAPVSAVVVEADPSSSAMRNRTKKTAAPTRMMPRIIMARSR